MYVSLFKELNKPFYMFLSLEFVSVLIDSYKVWWPDQ